MVFPRPFPRLLIVGLLLLLPACKATQAPAPENIVSGVGTVQYVDLEGGFYGIVAEDGTRYNPGALGERFQRDGLKVRFRATVREDVMTIQMWGTPVRILEITPAEGIMDGRQ